MIMNVKNVYKGDIFYIRKGGFVTGSEQYPERPAVVVSNDMANASSSVVEAGEIDE